MNYETLKQILKRDNSSEFVGLLESGLNANSIIESKLELLTLVMRNRARRCFSILLEKGVNVNSKVNGFSCLHEACYSTSGMFDNSTPIWYLEQLLNSKLCDLKDTNKQGQTPLEICIEGKDERKIKLIENYILNNK